jgi:hypothetical protein
MANAKAGEWRYTACYGWNWRSARAALPAGPACPCPWKDVTDMAVWNYDHLRIIGLARRGDAVGAGPAARALASGASRQSRPARRRSFRRHPSYPAFIAPDGSLPGTPSRFSPA